ncbi:MAG: hypothetical protein WDW38_005193 [Sanguina aurantia]
MLHKSVQKASCRASRTARPVACLPQQKPAVTATVVKAEAPKETRMLSTLAPLFTLALIERLSFGESVRQSLLPQAEYFASLNLPSEIIKFGHPGNMAVVLLAMGGYGSAYLGWQIRNTRTAEAPSEEAMTLMDKAKELHPKLAGGMFVFFAAGAAGGVLSEVMQGRPILESSHFGTAVAGLTLLALQAMLPLFFSEDPSIRTMHAVLGSSIMGIFLVHASLGIQLATTL